MRIKYNTPKGKRYKKGTIKLKEVGQRLPIFQCLLCSGYLWHYKSNKWVLPDDKYCYEFDVDAQYFNVKNIRQLVRHMKKHSEYLPKGTKFILVSRFNKVKDIVGLL